MGRWIRRSAAASLVIAWTMTGASAYALAASDEVAPAGPDSGPKLAIALATAGFLVVLLLLLRVARIRRLQDAASSGEDRADARDSVSATPPSPTELAAEAHLPRWRRPSVVAARFGLTGSAAGMRVDRLAFDGQPETDQEVERLVVRYDAVPLVDQPDDVHGRTIDELATGDEVEVIDRQALWIQVRTPAGRAGWVPAMTLARLDELPPSVWAATEEAPTEATPVDDGPPLEALLAAIVAQRRTQTAAAGPAPDGAPATEPRAKRARTPRQPSTPRAPTRRKAAASES